MRRAPISSSDLGILVRHGAKVGFLVVLDRDTNFAFPTTRKRDLSMLFVNDRNPAFSGDAEESGAFVGIHFYAFTIGERYLVAVPSHFPKGQRLQGYSRRGNRNLALQKPNIALSCKEFHFYVSCTG